MSSLYTFNDVSFFDTFDGDFNDKIFHSFTQQFEYSLENSLLSIKAANNLSENYYTENAHYCIPGGNYAVINPKECIHSIANSQVPIEGISIFISTKTFNEVAYASQKEILGSHECDYSGQRYGQLEEINLPMSCDILGKYLFGMFNGKSDNLKSKALFYTLSELLIESQVIHGNRIRNIIRTKRSVQLEIYQRLELARSYIKDNREKRLKVAYLATMSAMSEYHFIRQFKRTYGITPYQFILSEKISYSKELIKTDHYSISEISDKAGFSDVAAFGKSFRKWVGTTPTDYRNNKKNSN